MNKNSKFSWMSKFAWPVLFLLILTLILSPALGGCGSGGAAPGASMAPPSATGEAGGAGEADSGDPEYESRAITVEGLPGGTAFITVAELRALPQYDLEGSYQRTTGMVESFAMRGPYLSEAIRSLGGNLSDYAGVGVVGSDAYYCLISRELIESTPDLMLAVTIDGEAKLDGDTAPARLAVQGQFGPYWVKMVDRLVLYQEIPKKEITSVWAFDSLTEGIDPYLYEYYGSKDASVELAQIFSRFDYVDSRAFFTMKSSDGFKKNEVINMVKARYYIKTEGADAPTNISPYIKLGMNVQHIAWFSTNADAVIFLEEMMKYMDIASVGGRAGIPLNEALYEVGVEALRGHTFRIQGAAGEKVTVPGEDLGKGILTPGPEKGVIQVVWQPGSGYDDVGRLLRIQMVTEADNPQGSIAGDDGQGDDGQAGGNEPGDSDSQPDPDKEDGAGEGEIPALIAEPGETESQPTATAADRYTEPSEDTILTIEGDGVERSLYFTLNDLKEMKAAYCEEVYSTLNNWPASGYTAAKGADIQYLLALAGLKPGAQSVRAASADGYYANFTIEQLTGPLYRYPRLDEDGAVGRVKVSPIAAWAFMDGTRDPSQAREDDLRLFVGQDGIGCVNTSAMVKQLTKITVSAADPGRWPAPVLTWEDGLFVMDHELMDQVKIHYALGGAEPTTDSPVYNPSTSYFQPDLNEPLPLKPGVAVKAIAVGFGRYDSEVAVAEPR